MVEPAFSILVLTEDSGKQGQPTVEALTRCILRRIDGACNLAKAQLEPLADESLEAVVHANLWKSTRDEHRATRIALHRHIAAALVQKARPAFVVFHVDGDRPWGDRATSENLAKFRDLIEKPVWRLIERRVQKQSDEERTRITAEARSRLFLLMPFYSIEAWLYQNTREALRILHERHGGSHRFQFEEWSRDRRLLDEVIKPKRADVSPLEGFYNLELASTGFPTEEVEGAGKSFAENLARMRASEPLRIALSKAR